jgi:hypothetical protein
MATTTGTAGSSLGAGGGTSMAGLADWAAPYITGYLGQAQALANKPYEVYQGPLTAGQSNLQTKAFSGIGGLTVGNLGAYSPVGGSFTDTYSNPSTIPAGGAGPTVGGGTVAPSGTGAFTSTGFGQPSTVAQQYMNPYLQQALDPQLKELQRQADIQRVADAKRLTEAGAFGGSRQAIMESEGRRNLMDRQSSLVGQGYATAYDKAMQQYNAEQARKIQEAQYGTDLGFKGLEAERGIYKDMLGAGSLERDIEQQGITADLSEFNAQREYPYKQVQFMRDMISGLPSGSVTNTPPQLSGIAQLFTSAGGIDKFLKDTGIGDLKTALSKLGLDFGGTT